MVFFYCSLLHASTSNLTTTQQACVAFNKHSKNTWLERVVLQIVGLCVWLACTVHAKSNIRKEGMYKNKAMVAMLIVTLLCGQVHAQVSVGDDSMLD